MSPSDAAAADGGQEGLHHNLEPDPVDGRIVLADDRLEPGDQLLLDALGELVPQARRGSGPAPRPRRRPPLWPGPSSPGVGHRSGFAGSVPASRPRAYHSAIQPVRCRVAGDPEGGQQERPGERFQRVAARPVGAVGSGQVDVGVVRGAVAVGGAQQVVGVGAPVPAGQAGVGRELAVQCRQGQSRGASWWRAWGPRVSGWR